MKILIACERSGIVRDAFLAKGHDAWSVDIMPSDKPTNHLQCDVLSVINDGWDMMIAHPPCTYTSQAGNRWFKTQPDRMEKALKGFKFFMEMINAPMPLIAVENTLGLIQKWYRKHDQIIQPWQFGDPFQKSTCLWLKGLPPLLYSNYCIDYFHNWTQNGGQSNKSKERSQTFPGIANAMANQWGNNV